MNKFTKVGITALAGSLASFAASAVELTATGSAQLTYVNGHASEVTGNPTGMNTSIAFSGAGEVNGYATTLTIVNSDTNAALSSASLAVDLGDLGKITYDQGVGAGGISTIDDKTPSANEEVWDSLDAVSNEGNALVGGGNSGVFVFANTYSDINLSASVSKGGRTAQSDGAVGGEGISGTSWDFALTNQTLYEGVDFGFGYGEIANLDQGQDEHSVAYANYSMGIVTAGVTMSKVEDTRASGTDEIGQGFGIAVNVNDSLSVSYGEREVEFEKTGATDVTEDMEGFAVAYTMGSAKLSFQKNKTSNNGGTLSNNDENSEIALKLAF